MLGPSTFEKTDRLGQFSVLSLELLQTDPASSKLLVEPIHPFHVDELLGRGTSPLGAVNDGGKRKTFSHD
jgi:hypothetical protein